jgi:hypothetical protein
MLKKQIFGLGFSLASIFLMASVEAYQPVSDASLVAGWRKDEIKTRVDSDFGIGREIKYKDMKTWEFGLRGQYAITGFSCGCDDAWLDQFYVKGSAVWGWGNSGKATYSVFNDDEYSYGYGYDNGYGYNNVASTDLHHTKTHDYALGLGWVYSIDCNWAIAPTVGYAWDKLSTKSKGNNDSYGYGYADYDYNDNTLFSYSSKWHGPWLGAELLYEDCEWHFDLGYEFHWASHRNTYKAHGCDFGSVTTKSKSRYGNVVYVDAWYDLCDGWEVGLGFKYTHFQSGKGKRHFSANDCGYDYGYDYDLVSGSGYGSEKSHTNWTAWGFTLDVGYQF